jgi:SepF-like predicted cell division protein (DUF552 family)
MKYSKKLNKKYSKKRRTTKKHLNTYKKRNKKYMGGHENEDLEHYHLYIKCADIGKVMELPEVFRHSKKERNLTAANIGDLKEYAKEKFGYLVPEIASGNFYLSWKGEILEPDELKIRDIMVREERLPLYKPDIKNPIIVHINDRDYPQYPVQGTTIPNYASDSDTD